MKFPISRTDLYKELADLGYKESTRIDSPNQVLLMENRGIVKNTITLKGSGIIAMSGLTNQNPSIVLKNAAELVTYNTTYAKTSALSLDTGLVDDTKLDQYIAASGIDKTLFIDTSLYSIEVATDGSIKVNFTDIFDDGLILLPLVDGKAYQLDQLDKLGAATDPVLRFATGKSFTKANVLANRKLVPGKTGTYFIPLVLKVTAVGEFPNFTVNAVEPNQSLVNYLAIGPNEISGSALTVGWMGVNAITDTQFRPSLASPLSLALAIRQFKVPSMPLSYASVAVIDALKAKVADPSSVISYADYTSTLTGATTETRTINIVYNEDFDKTKKQVLQVYTLPIMDATALSQTVAAGDFNVLSVNDVLYKASEVLDGIVEDSGKFYLGFPVAITETPITTNFKLNVGGLSNTNTEWVDTSWTTTVTQTIPQDLVVPVTKLANKFVKNLSEVDGGFKSGIKHMRVEFDVPANQEFAYGFSDITNLTVLDESAPGTFEVVRPVSTVAIAEQTLNDGKIIRNTTDSVATLRLYIQVQMTAVNQSIGSNYLVESQVTAGAVFDLANSTIRANGSRIFLKDRTANTTKDILGYSHRYQRYIGANQAIKFKYNSVMAQSVSFGSALPLDHTGVVNYQSTVISPSQTKVLINSDGQVIKVTPTDATILTRIDLREGVYIEVATDDAGTGLIVTQLQYADDNINNTPYILRITDLPGILEGIGTDISVHISGVGLASGTSLFVTDIYDVVHVNPTISCSDNSPLFNVNLSSLNGSVEVNDAEAITLASFVSDGWGDYTDGLLTLSSKLRDGDTRLRIRGVSAFMTESQLLQENKAWVIYDQYGNILDPSVTANYTVVNSERGISFSGVDVCLAEKVCPVIDLTDALSITDAIDLTGNFQIFNDCELTGTESDIEGLVDQIEAMDPNLKVHVLDTISSENSKPSTESLNLTGRWYVELNGEILSHEDMSIAELKEKLLPLGIDIEIK